MEDYPGYEHKEILLNQGEYLLYVAAIPFHSVFNLKISKLIP
jgi:hypothetical protein